MSNHRRFPRISGGAGKISEAKTALGKLWTGFEHIINPASIPGKVAAGTVIGAGAHALTHPSQAEAGQDPTQLTAPPAVSDTGSPQITPVGEQLPKGWKVVGGTSPQVDTSLPKGWKVVGSTPAPAPANLPKGWTLVPEHVEAEHAQKQSDDSWWGPVALGTATALGIALLSKGRDAKSALELSRRNVCLR